MFGFGNRKRRNQVPPKITSLSDDQIAAVIRSTISNESDVVAAMFLIAYENFRIYFPAFTKAAKESGKFSPTLEGMASFLDDGRSKHLGSSIDDEASRRRYFYLYLVVLLKILHKHAKEKPQLWDTIATVWVALLPGARALRRTIDTTSLWTSDETVWFADVRNENDGEEHCLSMIAPPEIRYHKQVQDWQDRDLSPELKAELEKADKLLRGE